LFIREFYLLSSLQLLRRSLNLEQAIQVALERNIELTAKREGLGMAGARANLFLQQNPELEGEVENFRVLTFTGACTYSTRTRVADDAIAGGNIRVRQREPERRHRL